MSQAGEQAACIGRYAVLAAGWPEHVPGVTVDRQCGSSQQAVHQAAAGVIAGQITPVTVTGEDGTERAFDTDEGVRRGGTPEKLAGVTTPFKEGGVISAGNASQISDGSAALLVTTSEIAARNGWTPLARFHTGVVTGADPVTMLKGPVPATEKALKRSGLSIGDIGAFEINEAFASVSLSWQRQTGADYERLNPTAARSPWVIPWAAPAPA